MSEAKNDFKKKIHAVFLFFILFAVVVYLFVYITNKISGSTEQTLAQKPVENLENMTNPSQGGELVYKLVDNGSLNISEKEPESTLEEPLGRKKEAQADIGSSQKELATNVAQKPAEKKLSAPVVKQPAPKPVAAKATVKVEPKKEESSAPKPVTKGAFVLQISAYKNEEVAKAEAAKLKKNFPDIHIVRIDLGAKGVWYRLRCSFSQTYEEAQKKRDSIKAKYRLEPIIVKQGS